MGKKRFRKIRRTPRQEERRKAEQKPLEEAPRKERSKEKGLLGIYDRQYKKLLIIPFLILLLALTQITVQTIHTGDFLNKGVSLKGGITVTIPTQKSIESQALQQQLTSELPGNEINVRIINTAGVQTAVVIESDMTESDQTAQLLSTLEKDTGIDKQTYSVDVIGSSLGASFFKEIMIALAIAFLFMGTVVFIYFRTFAPSLAVILAAFSDVVTTLAVVNIMGIKLSTAGIAAFLMLIGYSIDTDILLSTRLLKRKDGSEFERLIMAAKTGLTMSATTIAAVITVLIFAKSEVLTQIMTILFIGLLADLINTWIQNVGLLRLYLEKKKIGKS